MKNCTATHETACRIRYKILENWGSLADNSSLTRIGLARFPHISFTQVDVDARPSDALNLAVRFGCPIYVHREIASRMGQAAATYDHPEETHGEILKTCKCVAPARICAADRSPAAVLWAMNESLKLQILIVNVR